MTNERIQAMVAKRVFGLFYNDEWSGLIFSIRRVHSIKQFTYVETNKELVSKRLLKMGQEYLFESKRVIFLAGGSYDHCHKYFDLYSDFYFKFGPSVFNSNSRSWLFNRQKTISEANKECENNWHEPFYKRKMFNLAFDDPHLMDYQIDYKTVVYK